MPRSRTGILTVVILFFGFGLVIKSVPLASADFSLSATLRDPNPTAGENFGSSVAISLDGGSILIGAPGATASGVRNAGEALLFDSSGNLVRTFQDPSPVEGEHFGSSVAISGRGSSILVGAPDVPNFPHPGFAFLFDSSGNLIQTFKDPILQKAHFAMSVAISNNGRSILIGAPGFGDFRGEAFLFDSSGNLLQTFEPGSHVGPINFGASVSMSAYTRNVLVGAPFDFGPTGTMIGSAFLFDSGGNLLQNLHDPSPEAGEQFGSSVFISAESRTIIVGAPLATSGSTGDAGKAFLFDSDGDLLQTFRGGIEGGRLGTSVSLSGDGSAVLIGETGRHDFGHAYLFDSFGNLLQTVSGRNFPDSFGFSVAISGHHTPTQMDAYQHNHAQNSFVVGAPYANVPDSSGVIGEGLAFLYAGP